MGDCPVGRLEGSRLAIEAPPGSAQLESPAPQSKGLPNRCRTSSLCSRRCDLVDFFLAGIFGAFGRRKNREKPACYVDADVKASFRDGDSTVFAARWPK